MPNTIRHKRGTTTPAAAALVTGELAINTATGTVFTKTDAGTVVSLGGLSLADLGNGNATAGALVLDALDNSNAPSATNYFATRGDVDSAVTSFSAQIGVVRAWVNFNGTGTVTINRALNVSSITDNGVGDYTVNFTTALTDTTYALVSSSYGRTGFCVGLHTAVSSWTGVPTLKSTTAARIATSYYDANLYDTNEVHVAFLR